MFRSFVMFAGLMGEPLKLGPRPARGEPVGHVTFHREAGQRDDPDARRDAAEAGGDLLDVLAAFVVVVG